MGLIMPNLCMLFPDTPSHEVFECPSVQDDVQRLRTAIQRLGVNFEPRCMVAKKQSFALFTRHVREVMGARRLLHPYYN